MKNNISMRSLMTLATLLALSGCATNQSPEMLAKQAEISRTVPLCTNEKDCSAKWDAAQLWVIHNAAFKSQTATNVLIETYNPTDSSPEIAVRVTKEPMGGGKYQFLVSVWCDNIFGCQPNTGDTVLNFNRTVGAVTP